MKLNKISLILFPLLISTQVGMANGASNKVFFNTNEVKSDTVGDFRGEVSFAQNSIIPSQNGSIPGDIQPHLTSLRKTLVLFTPEGNSAIKGEVYLKVMDKNNSVVYEKIMATPDKLPSIFSNDSAVVKPDTFGRIISDRQTVEKIGEDRSGAFLASVLQETKSLNIKTSDGIWRKDFHLPAVSPELQDTIITFASNAEYPSTIHTEQGEFPLSKGDVNTFRMTPSGWQSDYGKLDDKIVYRDNTFSGVIPAKFVTPGMKLMFLNEGKSGQVFDLRPGAPGEVLFHTIDLGMLTEPRGGLRFVKEKGLQREYFQQIPVRRMTVSQYETQYFKEVMLPDGRLLTDFDPSEGGFYSGDMRGYIAKALVSHGINNANYGLNSSGSGQNYHSYDVAQMTVHTSVGMYANGRQIHGLSGGDGMITLQDTVGNEFSHEVGHAYGLGHYPGGFNGVAHRPASEVNSTWGWDGDKNNFIPNFEFRKTFNETCYEGTCVPPFMGYSFGRGSMSGGSPYNETVNHYTLHTPFELATIQMFLESKAVFSPDSLTGFMKWDAQSEEMLPWSNQLKDDLSGESKGSVARVPYKQGIAVSTLVGYYDPQRKLSSYVYPAMHGSYGAVYEDNFSPSTCQLHVESQNAGKKIYNLHAKRLDKDKMNKFHVNVEDDLIPTKAELFCDGEKLFSRDLVPPKEKLTTSVISTEASDTQHHALSVLDVTASEIKDKAASIHFKVKAEGEMSFKVSVVDGDGKQLTNLTESLKDEEKTLSLQLKNVSTGRYQLIYQATLHDGQLIKHETLDIELKDGSASYDFLFPEKIKSYKAGTIVKQPKDGKLYQCKPFPYSGFCIQWSASANQFEPGFGSHWENAWIQK